MAETEFIAGPSARVFGYARVSSKEQDTAMQVKLFRASGVHLFFADSASGVKRRPELEKVLSYLEPGDELVVYKVDRLARSMRGLLEVLQAVAARGARFRSLTEPFDTATLTGRLMLQMLGAFAEFERGMIVERVTAGVAAARDRGALLGRRRTIDYESCLAMRRRGALMREIAEAHGCTKAGVWRALRVAAAVEAGALA